MYAIIEACGKQYKVVEGDVVFFEKLDTEVDRKITFDNIILVSDNDKIQIGNPYVKGVKVEGKVLSHGRGKKIIVFKMKAKKNVRKTQGHRQPYTKIEITSIKLAGAKTVEEKTEKATETVEKKVTAKKTDTVKATEKKPAVKKETAKK